MSHVSTLSAILFLVTVFMAFIVLFLKSKPETVVEEYLHTVTLYGMAFAPGGQQPNIDYFSFPPLGFFNWYGKLDTEMCFNVSSLTTQQTDLNVNYLTLYSSNTGFETYSEINSVTGGELCYAFNEKLYGPIGDASLTLHIHHTTAFPTPTFAYKEQWSRAFLRGIYSTYFPDDHNQGALLAVPAHFF